MQKTWRTYFIGTCKADAKGYYAYDLLEAFNLARINRFGSVTIHCFGSY